VRYPFSRRYLVSQRGGHKVLYPNMTFPSDSRHFGVDVVWNGNSLAHTFIIVKNSRGVTTRIPNVADGAKWRWLNVIK